MQQLLNAQEYLAAKKGITVVHRVDVPSLRRDRNGAMNVGSWIGIVITAVVLLIVLAALYPTLNDALASYEENDTSGFGTILVVIVPVLIGVGVLLAFVAAFLGKKYGG